MYELTDRKGHLLIKKITKIDVQAKNDTDDLYEFDCWSRIAGHGSRLLKRFVLALLAIKLIYFIPSIFLSAFKLWSMMYLSDVCIRLSWSNRPSSMTVIFQFSRSEALNPKFKAKGKHLNSTSLFCASVQRIWMQYHRIVPYLRLAL